MNLENKFLMICIFLLKSIFVSFQWTPTIIPIIWVISTLWIVHLPKLSMEHYWFGWLTYGIVWNDECITHPYFAIAGSLLGTGVGFLPLYYFQQKQPPPSWIQWLFYGTLFLPGTHNVFTHWSSWDILFHTIVFFITFFFQQYVSIFLKREQMFIPWMLFVSKWCLPFIGIHWMILAYEITTTFSKRHEEMEAKEDQTDSPTSSPSPPLGNGAVFSRPFNSYRKNLVPNNNVQSLMSRSHNISSV